MHNNWLESRKDIFMRDLVSTYFEAKVFFEKLLDEYRTTSSVPYGMVDSWIGSESKKGLLWDLTDQCHKLFRNSVTDSNLFEILFDWTIGSIFHEAIKMKEDTYQIEAYRPLLELEVFNKNKKLSQIVNEYFSLIENARKNLDEELARIHQLFLKSACQLIEILPLYRNNTLLVRLLLDNHKKLPERILGKETFVNILHRMFPDGVHNGYIAVAEKCLDAGWPKDATRYLKKALQFDSKNIAALELLKKIEEKSGAEKKEEPQT